MSDTEDRECWDGKHYAVVITDEEFHGNLLPEYIHIGVVVGAI